MFTSRVKEYERLLYNMPHKNAVRIKLGGWWNHFDGWGRRYLYYYEPEGWIYSHVTTTGGGSLIASDIRVYERLSDEELCKVIMDESNPDKIIKMIVQSVPNEGKRIILKLDGMLP